MNVKTYHLWPTDAQPLPYDVEIHPLGCTCEHCEPPCPSVPARLTAVQLAKLTIAGVLIGHAIAALIWGPTTVLHILVANLTGARL